MERRKKKIVNKVVNPPYIVLSMLKSPHKTLTCSGGPTQIRIKG